MRISDWSSDVCSSDLAQERQALLMREMNHRIKNLFALTGGLISLGARTADSAEELEETLRERVAALARAHALTMPEGVEQPAGATNLIELLHAILSPYRSEEPPSELPPIMRSSYAVFC